MLSILCPHCREKLTLEERWQGKTIKCLSCGKQLAVPVANKSDEPVAPPQSPVVVTTAKSSTMHRRRQRAAGNRIISVILHLSISLAAVYAGYYLITNRPVGNEEPAAEIAKLPNQRHATDKSAPVELRREKADFEVPIERIEPPVLEPVGDIVEKPTSPFANVPTLVSLPAVHQTEDVPLIEGLRQPEVKLVSNSPDLALKGHHVHWQPDEGGDATNIATISLIEGSLSFRWSTAVDAEAETELRNSIVCLHENDLQHVLRLRGADSTSPLKIDLGESQQKIVGKFTHLAPAERVCFRLLNLDELPPCTVAGVAPEQLQIGDQTTLEYLEAPGAATRLTMYKRGNVTIVDIESRYALPSGDEQPLSIAQGNKKINELDALYQETLAAEAAIDGLRDRLKEVERNAKAVPRSRATALAKAQQLQRLQADALAVRKRIAYAERLIANKETIAADQQALKKVATVAQQLHEARLCYCFFIVVDGHQVDLLVARDH